MTPPRRFPIRPLLHPDRAPSFSILCTIDGWCSVVLMLACLSAHLLVSLAYLLFLLFSRTLSGGDTKTSFTIPKKPIARPLTDIQHTTELQITSWLLEAYLKPAALGSNGVGRMLCYAMWCGGRVAYLLQWRHQNCLLRWIGVRSSSPCSFAQVGVYGGVGWGLWSLYSFLYFTSLVGGRGRSMGGVIDGWMKARGWLFFERKQ